MGPDHVRQCLDCGLVVSVVVLSGEQEEPPLHCPGCGSERTVPADAASVPAEAWDRVAEAARPWDLRLLTRLLAWRVQARERG